MRSVRPPRTAVNREGTFAPRAATDCQSFVGRLSPRPTRRAIRRDRGCFEQLEQSSHRCPGPCTERRSRRQGRCACLTADHLARDRHVGRRREQRTWWSAHQPGGLQSQRCCYSPHRTTTRREIGFSLGRTGDAPSAGLGGLGGQTTATSCFDFFCEGLHRFLGDFSPFS